MSVILTEMDIPEDCFDCKIRKSCSHCKSDSIPIDRRKDDCPLKSIDGLIDKFKENYPENIIRKFGLGLGFSLKQVTDIIKKYFEE